MIETNYLLGLELSKNISFISGGVFFVLMSYIIWFSEVTEGSNWIAKLLGYFLFFIISVGISIISFLVIYPLLNLVLHKSFNLVFYTKEISQGTLSLRFTSVLLGFNFLRISYNLIAEKFSNNYKELIADYPDLQNISSYNSEGNISAIILSQNLIYGATVLLLWIFVFLSKSFFEIRLIIWGLFFIVDDWAIISDNLIALKGRILRWHRIRILFFNGLLFCSVVSACFRRLDNLLYSIIVTTFLLIVVLANTFFFLINDPEKQKK